MTRSLTKSQKRLLDREKRERPDLIFWDDIYLTTRAELKSINDTEILWSECERYLQDN